MRDRVERGAAILEPGWYNKVNAVTLDISNPQLCMFGQLYGGWVNGLSVMREKLDGQSIDFGFNGRNRQEQDELTVAWRELIAEHRLAEVRELVAA